MILASPVFKIMLTRNFQEGITFKTNGVVNIELDDDPTVLLVLLNIIHGRFREVPRKIDLKMHIKIVMLVDYYECHESTEPFASMWIEDLKTKIPTSLNDDVVPWLCISWILGLPNEFKSMTKILIWESCGNIDEWTVGYPMPGSVIGQCSLHKLKPRLCYNFSANLTGGYRRV